MAQALASHLLESDWRDLRGRTDPGVWPKPMLDLFVLARSLSVLPNMRVKLAAPVPNRFGSRRELRRGRFSFVILPARRRSLSAIR